MWITGVGHSMVMTLKGQELMDGADRDRVRALEAYLSAAGQTVCPVSDEGFTSTHHGRPRNISGVHEAGYREVSLRKGAHNAAHVFADPGDTCRVGGIAYQADAPAVGERLEVVRGGVLIDAHGALAALLYPGKCAVGRASRIFAGTRRALIGPAETTAHNQSEEENHATYHGGVSLRARSLRSPAHGLPAGGAGRSTPTTRPRVGAQP